MQTIRATGPTGELEVMRYGVFKRKGPCPLVVRIIVNPRNSACSLVVILGAIYWAARSTAKYRLVADEIHLWRKQYNRGEVTKTIGVLERSRQCNVLVTTM